MAIFIFVCMFEMLPATSHTCMARHKFEATVQLEMKEAKKDPMGVVYMEDTPMHHDTTNMSTVPAASALKIYTHHS